MGVNWDRRSIEFRLLFFKYNKQLYYTINTQQLHSTFLGTLVNISSNANNADKVSERLKQLQDYQTSIIDSVMYGSIKKQQQISEADRLAAKIEFLKKVRPIAFKGLK